jgi:hypothetical protein
MTETNLSPTARNVPLEWVLDYLAALERGLLEIDAESRKRVIEFAEAHYQQLRPDDVRPDRVRYLEGIMNGLDLLHTSVAHQVYKHGARSCQGVFDQNLASKFGYDGETIQSGRQPLRAERLTDVSERREYWRMCLPVDSTPARKYFRSSAYESV